MIKPNQAIMARAIELARNAPKFPFGAAIVEEASGEIVAEGWNQSAQNPTWHGEIVALNNYFSAGRNSPSDCVLYTTAEPCPMCQSAIIWAGIRRVCFGTSIAYLTRTGWNQIRIDSREVCRRAPFVECDVVGGVMEEECNQLFDRAMEQRRQVDGSQ